MTALSGFLLARIAVEEASDGWHTVECGVGLGYWATGQCICGYPTRVLAECEAKRRLILACTHEVENWVVVRPGVRQNMPVRVPWGDDDLYEDVLKFLALPYADHPDYDPSWRP